MDPIRTRSLLLADTPRLRLYSIRSKDDIESDVERTKLGATTAGELLRLLAESNTNGAQADEQELFLKLKALAYVHPESCVQLGGVLQAAPSSSVSFRVLAGALGSVAHREAQGALIQALPGRESDPPALSVLVSTLGNSPQPTMESESAVRQLADHSPDSEEEKALLLQSLGNAATPTIFATLSHFAEDSSPRVRAAALDGARFVPLRQADTLLCRSLASDRDWRVRLEAAFALGFRQVSQQLLFAEQKAARTDSDEKVRKAVLENLVRMSEKYPQARGIVEQMATTDQSKYVRDAAREFLERIPARR